MFQSATELLSGESQAGGQGQFIQEEDPLALPPGPRPGLGKDCVPLHLQGEGHLPHLRVGSWKGGSILADYLLKGSGMGREEVQTPGGFEEGGDNSMEAWTDVVKGKRSGRKQAAGLARQEEDLEVQSEEGGQDINRSLTILREERMKTSTPARRVAETREGDWRCKDERCAYSNFARRDVCLKCKKDRQGVLRLGASQEQGALLGKNQARREYSLRHPKMMILSINLIKDGKPGQKPRTEDHIVIMRQAGLNLDEVRGKVGKNGYLEVALEHGAESGVRALREGSKEVDSRYTISSVREQGASREVTVRWLGVPFSVQDETLYSYLEQFSKPVRQVRNLWWVKDEPGEGLGGVWNAERTLVVHLNPGVGHVPVWHYVGGAKMKMLVPGKRSCPRCLKSVGDCKGGGAWGACEEAGASRGDWKLEQERFLKNVGSSLEMQKALERDLQEVEIGPEDPDLVAEMRAEAEKLEADTEAKEVLVYRVPQGKICGGVRLQGFPEGTGSRKTEKREAILTIIELCNDLSQQEEERLVKSDVEVSRPDRGRKGTVEVKVMLNNEDELMRKVWSQLEVPCKEEGVKRFMVEASTQMSPAKEKPKTTFQKARQRVGEHIREEEKDRKKALEEENNKASNEEESEVVAEVAVHVSQSPKVIGAGELTTAVRQPESEEITSAEEAEEKEGAPVKKPELEDEESEETLEKKNLEELDPIRVKGQKWTPPSGKRRCSGNCVGCRTKCKELNLPDCHNCHLNKMRMNNHNGCCNRGPCTNMKVVKAKKEKITVEEEPLSEERLENNKVDDIINDFERKGMDKEHREIEEELQNSKKRDREKGGTPEALKKPSQIARLNGTVGQSKLTAPGRSTLLSK